MFLISYKIVNLLPILTIDVFPPQLIPAVLQILHSLAQDFSVSIIEEVFLFSLFKLIYLWMKLRSWFLDIPLKSLKNANNLLILKTFRQEETKETPEKYAGFTPILFPVNIWIRSKCFVKRNQNCFGHS